MHLVINNANPQFREYLLGACYDKEEDLFQFTNKSRPRANVNI